ncbi:MAG: hypothetical protein PHQ60_13850 [Sideroxydans sp.]|nr:hypothetical protein [Sideroxydans sp.]
MSIAYLPEHAENALLALELAEKEVAHLAYTHRTLFAQPIDLLWVQALEQREDLAEKVDAFVSRFGRLQDHIGEKLIPRFIALLGSTPQSLLDNLAYAEKTGWMENTESFVSARKLRNLLVHEYMAEAELFLESLLAADDATRMLMDIVARIKQQAQTLGLDTPR